MLNVMSKRKDEKENQERSDKRKTTVLGVAVVVSLVTLIAIVFLLGPRFSGFLVAGTEFSHQQAIGQEFSSNANYTLSLERLPSENFTLKSLMVSGSVIGDGSAKVYLVSGDTKLRVFDSSSLRERISPITAFSVAEQPEVSVQPELPPSSELDNAQGGAGTDTTPAGSPGAENPPADEAPPAEQLPAEQPPAEQPVETPATHETIPSEKTVTGYCDTEFYCRQDYDAAMKEHYKHVFYLALPIGVIVLVVGAVFFGLESVGAGLMGGGIVTLIYGAGGYWQYAQNWLKFLISLAGLIAVIYFAYWFNKRSEKKRKRR